MKRNKHSGYGNLFFFFFNKTKETLILHTAQSENDMRMYDSFCLYITNSITL